MLTPKHPFFPTFLALMREAAASAPVYDLGTSRRFSKEVGLARDVFREDAYFAGGYEPDFALGPDACDFHCDVQDLKELESGSAGSVISLSVLEHVRDPRRAAAEFHRVLRPGGLLIASVPFLLSYHGKRSTALAGDDSHESYGDYWRFTHEGLAHLFAEAGFAQVDLFPMDGWLISRLQVVGVYHALAWLPPLRWLMAKLDRPRLGRAATFHFVRARKA